MNLADPGPADLASAQAQLASDEALISFVFGQSSSYALVVRAHGFEAVPLAIGADTLSADVSDLRRAFVPALGHLPEFDLKNSYALYQSLIAPLHLDGVTHLIVIPGPVFSNLPLSLLVSEPAMARDYRNAAWLVRKYALSEVPSARAFVALASEGARRARAPRAFLGLGAPCSPAPTDLPAQRRWPT